jgi:uncharacterized protein (TIGR02001 family)
MIRSTLFAVLAASASLLASAASAQDNLSFNVGVTSDYVTRGSSQTGHDAAIQGGADYVFGDSGFYVGAWGSTVDFGDGTDAELDYYGGYRTVAAGWGLDFGLASYNYTNAPADIDMVEALVTATRTFGTVGTTFQVAYSPDYFNIGSEGVWLEAGATVPVADRLTLSGSVGAQIVEEQGFGNASYETWNVGLGYKLTDNLSADLRYTGNNLRDTDFGADFADDTVAFTINAAF